MPAPQKVNSDNFAEIHNYAVVHGPTAAAKKFGLSKGTINEVKSASSFETFRYEKRLASRKYYEARKNKIKNEVKTGPFDNAPKPAAVIPVQEPTTPNLNGPVEVRKLNLADPTTIEEYKLALEQSRSTTRELNRKVSMLTGEAEGWKRDCLNYREELTACQIELANAQRTVNKLQTELAEANVRLAGTETEPKPQDTKIEITVGEAKIVVTGGNCGINRQD